MKDFFEGGFLLFFELLKNERFYRNPSRIYSIRIFLAFSDQHLGKTRKQLFLK